MPEKTRISPYQLGAGRVMITDGGPHPASAWAQVTAEHIAPIGPDVIGERRAAALKLQAAIMLAVTPHHIAVQEGERSKLAADANHIMKEPDPEPHLDGAVAAIQSAAKGTEWEAHFQDSAVAAMIRQEVGSHFATVQHIEKSWHADRNPKHPAAIAFRAQHHPGEE